MNKLSIAGVIVLTCMGCNHTTPPPTWESFPTEAHRSQPIRAEPPTLSPIDGNPLPAPIVVQEPGHIRMAEYPCGREMEIHVGKGDVKLPHLDFEAGPSKVNTEGYVLHLEDATFRIRDYCLQEVH